MNKNRWYVRLDQDFTRYNGFKVYIANILPNHKIAVAKPVELIFELNDEGCRIEPTFEFASPELSPQDFCRAIIVEAIRVFPEIKKELREQFSVKVNTDEIKAMQNHIENLNNIIQSINPYKDQRRQNDRH